MHKTIKRKIESRQIAALIADGFDESGLEAMYKALVLERAQLKIIAAKPSVITGSSGRTVMADFNFLTPASSGFFEAIFIPGGAKSVEAISAEPDACSFVNEEYRYCKALSSVSAAVKFFKHTFTTHKATGKAIVFGRMPVETTSDFIRAISTHWILERMNVGKASA